MPTSSSFDSLQYTMPKASSPVMANALAVLKDRLMERCGLDLKEVASSSASSPKTLTIALALDPSIGTEGFKIESQGDNLIRILGNDDRGLFYGVGKFLHGSSFGEKTFTPTSFRGASVPECSMRGMYFAFHNNWFTYAPAQELNRYMEDLALWGFNCLAFHMVGKNYDMAPASPEAIELLRQAKLCGFRVALLAEPNVSKVTYPAVAAQKFPDANPPRRGQGGTVCPSIPEGFQLLSKMLEGYLSGYEEVGIDYVISYPYDAGGCGCKDCRPWGARGFVKISKEFSRLAKLKHPGCKFIAATWCFDVLEKSDGEYEGLDRELRKDKSWCDFIMDDSHQDEFPKYSLTKGVPGGLPMINFPEISMWGRWPWGGYGANPLPNRFQKIWDGSSHALDGGFPYSEGPFEDINKVVISHFYWNKKARAMDAVREYVSYEYSPELVDTITEAIFLLEKTYPPETQNRADVQRAYQLIQAADAKLPVRARQSWRWRILYLRSVIDFEMNTPHDRVVSDRCDAAFDELIKIFHLEKGWLHVTPRSRKYRKYAQDLQAAALVPGAQDAALATQ